MFTAASTLQGSVVTLRPLEPRDAPSLFAVTPPDTFRLFLSWPAEWTLPAFEAWMNAKLFGPKQRGLLVQRVGTGEVVGCSSFLDIDPTNKAVEIGSTWFIPSARGTKVNPEAKLLMLAHAFEVEQCVRVTLKTDARNERSRRAMAKMGATFEGVLRQHRIRQNGLARDTAYFSVTHDDWPSVKDGLRRRLAVAM